LNNLSQEGGLGIWRGDGKTKLGKLGSDWARHATSTTKVQLWPIGRSMQLEHEPGLEKQPGAKAIALQELTRNSENRQGRQLNPLLSYRHGNGGGTYNHIYLTLAEFYRLSRLQSTNLFLELVLDGLGHLHECFLDIR
jgi:hypothetical protein